MAGRAKYGNRKVVADGMTFDSVKEHARYEELRLLQMGGAISGLECQHSFDLTVNGIRVARYVSDFLYFEGPSKKLTVEDVKSPITRKNPVYRLKVKLLKACHNIEILET